MILKRNKRVESGSVPGRKRARREGKRELDIELEVVKHGYNKLIKHDITS